MAEIPSCPLKGMCMCLLHLRMREPATHLEERSREGDALPLAA